MKQKVNYKVAIVFYLVVFAATLILSYSNKQYNNKKSASTSIGITDTLNK